MYKDEIAAVKIAVKKALKYRNCEIGFLHLNSWYDRHNTRDIVSVLKCYRKAVKHFF